MAQHPARTTKTTTYRGKRYTKAGKLYASKSSALRAAASARKTGKNAIVKPAARGKFAVYTRGTAAKSNPGRKRGHAKRAHPHRKWTSTGRTVGTRAVARRAAAISNPKGRKRAKGSKAKKKPSLTAQMEAAFRNAAKAKTEKTRAKWWNKALRLEEKLVQRHLDQELRYNSNAKRPKARGSYWTRKTMGKRKRVSALGNPKRSKRTGRFI